FEQLVPAGSVFAATASQIDVVLRLRPGSLELRLDVSAVRHHEKRIGRKKRAYRGSRRLDLSSADLAVDRKNQRQLGVARRALGEQVEMTKLGDVVAPELEPHRFGHAETVNVEDPAAHAELRDVLDHRHALEADRFQVRGELLGAANISLAQL